MRVGLWGARACNTGLGTQTWSFWRHMKPAATAVLEYAHVNGKVSYPERYNGDLNVIHYQGKPDNTQIVSWLESYRPDVVFCAETPYNYDLYKLCKQRGIKTFCQYNFEFLRHMYDTKYPFPDVFMAPTSWCTDRVQAKLGHKVWVQWLPVPVDDDRFSVDNWRPLERITRFLHVAGYRLHEDRNGTHALLQAIPKVRSQHVEFVILSQHPLQGCDDPRVRVINENLLNYWDLYSYGDCLILPRRYGGLCLPCQEAMAAGLPVIMPEISPNQALLHPRTMFPVRKINNDGKWPIADIDPSILAAQIDRAATWETEEIDSIREYQLSNVCWWSEWAHHYMEFFSTHL